jgi:DNA-binding response OmpR family regulator
MRQVLVVEDEPRLRSCLSGYLKRHGWRVTEAGSLAEANALLLARVFDAAVLDVGLPDGDGLELLARTGPQRSLVVSARPDTRRYASRGVVHHLPKPLDLITVAERVSSLCASQKRTECPKDAGETS